MSDQSFLNSIYKLAERGIGRSLTAIEKEEIIVNFNKSIKTNPKDKAIDAIDKTLNTTVELLLEKSSSLDAINNLLIQMSAEAEQWAKK